MKRFFNEMPIFVIILGMCSTLAVSTTFENSYIMGFSVLIILLLSNIIISLIGKYVKFNIRIPIFIVIITAFVTLTEWLLKEYATPMYDALGIYLPLIAVNCIILGRALSHAYKNNVISSIKDSLKFGFGYTFAISIIGIFREILGNNTITFMDKISNITGYRAIYEIYPNNVLLPNSIFLGGAGAFLILGLIIGIFNAIRNRGEIK